VVTVRAPPDNKRTRPVVNPSAFWKPSPNTTPAASLPEALDTMVRELAGHRTQRLLADLDLAPTVPVPCSGCCRCYGTPIGAECGS
jgi:hypothetical protein